MKYVYVISSIPTSYEYLIVYVILKLNDEKTAFNDFHHNSCHRSIDKWPIGNKSVRSQVFIIYILHS